MIWTNASDIATIQPTNQCLLLADGITKVKCDGCGIVTTSSGIRFPVLYVKNWPRNYVSVRVLNQLGYAVIFGRDIKIVRLRDGKEMHSSPSGTGLYTIDLFN